MKRMIRPLLGLAAGAAIIGIPIWWSFSLSMILQRECYRFAELVGIMNPAGDLGGQLAGFNYQRNPAWVHPVAAFLAGTFAFAPSLVIAIIVMHRVGFGPIGWRATLCGRCGTRMQGLAGPRCAACGAGFGA